MFPSITCLVGNDIFSEGILMDDKLLRYTLRVDRLLFQKFRYIAESEGRSANKEIEQYLKSVLPNMNKKTVKLKSINNPAM